MIKDAKQAEGRSEDLVVDLHPDRPAYRGIALPERIISLEADPEFEEMTGAGAVVDKQSKPHTVLDDFFLVSGEIPRVTPYETGLKYAVRYDPKENEWYSDELIQDERSLICNLKGKVALKALSCLIVLTCSRQRTRDFHRMQPRWCSQHHKTRIGFDRWEITCSCSGWRVPSRPERGRSD
jgi:hypothetical protein